MDVRAVPKRIECVHNGNRWTNRETSGGINHASVRPQGHDPCATVFRPFADGRPPLQGHGTADVDPSRILTLPHQNIRPTTCRPCTHWPTSLRSAGISSPLIVRGTWVKPCPLNNILSSQAGLLSAFPTSTHCPRTCECIQAILYVQHRTASLPRPAGCSPPKI
jgi:hypothetical protein